MESEDGEFDYRTLPTASIEQAIENIDPARHPKNLANARSALEARRSGASPEPPPLLDDKTDALYTLWFERIIGVVVLIYAANGVISDDLALPSRSRAGGIGLVHLHGYAAWGGCLGLIILAAVPILDGLDLSDTPKVRPQFLFVFRAALVVMAIAIAIQFSRAFGSGAA